MEASWDKALDSDYPTDGMHFFVTYPIYYLFTKLSAELFKKEGATTPQLLFSRNKYFLISALWARR